jgi:hypothetical protein
MTLIIVPAWLGWSLSAVVVSLISAHVTMQYLKYVHRHDTQLGLLPLLNLDLEHNLPAWYAFSSLLLCALLLTVIGWLSNVKAIASPFTGLGSQ